jgi:hypothetical protein
MRQGLRWLGIFTITIALGGPLLAQTTATAPPKKRRGKPAAASSTPAASQEDVQSLRDLVLAQQKQIETQNQQVKQLQDQLPRSCRAAPIRRKLQPLKLDSQQLMRNMPLRKPRQPQLPPQQLQTRFRTRKKQSRNNWLLCKPSSAVFA